MQNVEAIRESILYIEENLKTDITAAELAQMAGYSVWHYQRLFAQAVGMSLAAHINRRRLERALKEIQEKRKAVDVALEYGFDTYAGFYKSFLRAYGCSPQKYLALYQGRINTKETSRMYTEKELRGILTHWDIPQNEMIRGIQVMDGAKTAGTVWQVGKDYILKTGKRDTLLQSARIAEAIAAQGFAAAVPLPTKAGHLFATEEQGDFILMPRLKGGPLPKTERFGKGHAEYGFRYGQAIARLHRALAAVEEDIQPFEQNLFAHVTEWALPEVQKQNIQWDMGLPDSFFEEYTRRFGVLSGKLPRQLIHRDPNPGNILFSGGEVSGFIDFDLSERNVRLWDPCYCATGILSERRGAENAYDIFPTMLSSILRGYDSVEPLTADEKQAVYDVACSIQMICVAWFEGTQQHDLAKANRETLQTFARHREWFDRLF